MPITRSKLLSAVMSLKPPGRTSTPAQSTRRGACVRKKRWIRLAATDIQHCGMERGLTRLGEPGKEVDYWRRVAVEQGVEFRRVICNDS